MTFSFYKYVIFSIFIIETISGQNRVFKHFTTENGLPHDITYGIIQDRDNIIWIGTDDGLTKFNGDRFENFGYENGLTSNYVIDIVNMNKEKYAVATWGGGVHLFKNDTIFKPKYLINDKEKVNKLVYLENDSLYAKTSSRSFAVYTKNERKKYWVVNTSTGVTLTNKNNIAQSLGSYMISESVIDSEIFVHASIKTKINSGKEKLNGVYKINGDSLSIPFKFLQDAAIYSIYKSKSQTSYLLGGDNVILRVDTKGIIERFEFKELIKSKVIKLEIVDDYIYFITNAYDKAERGLYKFSMHSNELVCLSKVLNINNFISDFLVDNEKKIWITTYGDGVFVVPPTNNKFYGNETFINIDLKDALVINDDLYLLATNVLYRFNDLGVDMISEFSNFSENFIYDSKNNLLNIIVGDVDAIKYYENEKVNLAIVDYDTYSFSIGNHFIKIVKNDLKVYSNNIPIFEINNDSTIKKVAIVNGTLFVLTQKYGLQIYDIKTNKIIREFNLNGEFVAEKINDLLVKDRCNFLLATNRGLFSIDNKTITQYTTKNGLLSNHINSLIKDSFGRLWLGTQRGLNVMFKNKLYVIDDSQGQKSSFVTKVIEKEPFIYAVGNKGMFVYDNSKAFRPKVLAPLKIAQDKNEFKLFPMDLLNTKNRKIEYNVDDVGWVRSEKSKLNFNYLPEGRHKVLFRYKNDLSDWKETKSYNFVITNPWYSRSWFYIILIIVFSFLVFLILLKILQRSVKKNKELRNTIREKEKLKKTLTTVRRNLAKDFHDELGNKLASISVLTNLLILKNPKQNDLNSKLNKIKEDSDYLYSGMKDFVWSLNNENDSLDEVLIYLSEFGKNLFIHTEIDFFSASELKDITLTLPHYWSNQIIFIFKEAMTNALKHSKATKVIFSFEMSNNELMISLKDDGIGFNFLNSEKQNGVLNMKSRAQKIQTKLIIKSNQKGTEVVFKGGLITNL